MSTSDIIQIIGIGLSTIIGLCSLLLGISNRKKINQMGKGNIANSKKSKSVNQNSKVGNNSKFIQAGGNVSINGKTES